MLATEIYSVVDREKLLKFTATMWRDSTIDDIHVLHLKSIIAPCYCFAAIFFRGGGGGGGEWLWWLFPCSTLSCDKSEYVNPDIPTQIPEEDWSGHLQSLGWLLTSLQAWCLISWFANIESSIISTWHWIALLDGDQVSIINNTPRQTFLLWEVTVIMSIA